MAIKLKKLPAMDARPLEGVQYATAECTIRLFRKYDFGDEVTSDDSALSS